ncbi:hypothetical protein EJB05_01361 [Eragrostis curvula]|uniref:Uncharacterized protein n=1 Tax=Eragrostis curvula TaxID=38414 RepID=A0A5J9WRQ6_9POAL|nr:hypothetical protein EJB05_01361 [Eragrostis curvula]
MSYAYLFKYIIIGDTGPPDPAQTRRCGSRKVMKRLQVCFCWNMGCRKTEDNIHLDFGSFSDGIPLGISHSSHITHLTSEYNGKERKPPLKELANINSLMLVLMAIACFSNLMVEGAGVVQQKLTTVSTQLRNPMAGPR